MVFTAGGAVPRSVGVNDSQAHRQGSPPLGATTRERGRVAHSARSGATPAGSRGALLDSAASGARMARPMRARTTPTTNAIAATPNATTEVKSDACRNAESIAEGVALITDALARGPTGPYQLQAAIAALQTEDEVDWGEVAALYERLEWLTGSPVVALNRAAAIAEAGAPERALELVDSLELGDYRYVHSTRAELLRRLGRREQARAAFEQALRLAATDPERRFLARRLAGL